MSSCSRGLLFRLHRPQCLSHPPSRPCNPNSNPFTTAHHHLHPLPKRIPSHSPHKPTSPSQSKSKSKSKSPPPITTYQSYATTLAQKPHPTLLYTAPSHLLYTLSSYSAATFCFTYAAYNVHAHCLHPPPGLEPWVPVAFGGVCFLVSCFGTWMLLGPARLVSSITALPAAAAGAARRSGAGAGAGLRSGDGALRLEVELRKMFPLPFFPPRKIIAAPEDMRLGTKLYFPPVNARLSAVERLEMRRRLEKEQEEERRKSLLTVPFRDAKRAFGTAFKAIGRAWSREGFLRLTVKRQTYKLDVSGGWALDEGKALDRLVKLRL